MRAGLLLACLAAVPASAATGGGDATSYGAVCDGDADDSAAIQSCVDDSAREGVPCRLPGRVCAFGGPARPHAALTIPDGGGLTGNGALGVHGAVLLLRTDGGGPCGVGANGAVRMTDGNSTKLLAGLTLRSADAAAGCLVNASNAAGQVAGARMEDVDLFPAAGGGGTVGLYLGNIVTSDFERDYFAVGFAAAVVDGGAFANAVRFRDDFFDEPADGPAGRFMVSLGTVTGSAFTGNVFEAGPNGLLIRNGFGVEVSDNWMGDLRARSAGTWLSATGRGMRVAANFLNCEGAGARQTGLRVSGGGNVVEANWIDGPLVGIVAAGDAGLVKANAVFYPEAVGVVVSTGTGQEVGPNDVTVGGGRRAYACDPGAAAVRLLGPDASGAACGR